ncbi:MAG: hypothetical protein ACPGVK_01245 [Halocynthiibacter sp.]
MTPDTDHSGTQSEDTNDLVVSYLTIRQAIGWIGVLLPIVLIGFGYGLGIFQPSISAFYYTALREVFVAALCAVGMFLIAYKGYEKRTGEWISDRFMSTIAGFGALGVIFFPSASTSLKCTDGLCRQDFSEFPSLANMFIADDMHIENIHIISAFTFFIALSIMCLVNFRRGHKNEIPCTAKRQRNLIFQICGVLILICLALMAFYIRIPRHNPALFQTLYDMSFLFYVESIAIWAFGVSWLVKGGTPRDICKGLYEDSLRKTILNGR